MSLKSKMDKWRPRLDLLVQLIQRDVALQYKGSLLGIFWSLLTPLLMLAIYTIVFGDIFNARWGTATSGGDTPSRLDFALNIFCGLIVFNLVATVLTRAPSLIAGHANYVKKIIFPLSLLPVVTMGSALVQTAVALSVLVATLAASGSMVSWSAMLAPFVILPVVLATLGMAWLLAALGVFLRDLHHVVMVVVQVLMFLSPVFYPLEAVPGWLRPVLMINPLAWAIESLRATVLHARLPDWGAWSEQMLGVMLLGVAGYTVFRRLRPAFADVV